MKPKLLIVTGVLTSIGLWAEAADPRPNILWLTFEDTSPDFIGCYGNDMAKTPNIDTLAQDGVRFDAAFSTGAVSSPSRFCIITGVRAETTEVLIPYRRIGNCSPIISDKTDIILPTTAKQTIT